jgi:hypothetical protein
MRWGRLRAARRHEMMMMMMMMMMMHNFQSGFEVIGGAPRGTIFSATVAVPRLALTVQPSQVE